MHDANRFLRFEFIILDVNFAGSMSFNKRKNKGVCNFRHALFWRNVWIF